tara:strand:+ start:304 stop:513 length:210 start_codon:yes stop_codon:yes gene_type:complete
MTKQEEEDYIDSLYGVKSNILSPGEKTRRILKSRGIESPSLNGLVKVSSTPPTWKVPKKKVKKKKKTKK